MRSAAANPAARASKRVIREVDMSVRSRVIIAALWIVSLVGIGVIASAQPRREPDAVITGSDIGFRPEGWRGKARTGTWVVRINGEWVDALAAMKTQPATTR
jgi:hypothetical protein